MSGESIHATVAKLAAQEEEASLRVGTHPNAFAASLGASQTARVCATPDCGCLTEGTVLEEATEDRPAVMAYFSLYCEACVKRIKGEERAKQEAAKNRAAEGSRMKWWTAAWGGPDSQYHDTKLEKLPDIVAAEKALRWSPSHPKGLVLIGDTGSGKTRTVYLLLKRILLEQGIKPLIKRCAKIRHELAAIAKSTDENARNRYVREIIEAEILFLDDLGQAAHSESFGEAIFDIIEERTNRGLPIIATTQVGGSDFVSKFTDEKQGLAISRRLTESCYRVTFTRPTKELAKMEEMPS